MLATPELSFVELERLRTISRLLDLTYNAGCFPTFLATLARAAGSLAHGLERLAEDQSEHAWLRHPLGREGLVMALADATTRCWEPRTSAALHESLVYDLAGSERIVAERANRLFDTALTLKEADWAGEEVRRASLAIRGQRIKLQHFAAVFHSLPGSTGRTACLFLYRIQSGQGMSVEVRRFPDYTEEKTG